MIKFEGPDGWFYVNPRMIILVENEKVAGLSKFVFVGNTSRYVYGTADEIAVKINNIL